MLQVVHPELTQNATFTDRCLKIIISVDNFCCCDLMCFTHNKRNHNLKTVFCIYSGYRFDDLNH